MDGPKDYHTKCSKSDKDKQHVIPLVCRILKYDTNELIYRNRIIDIENKAMVTKGKGGGGN